MSQPFNKVPKKHPKIHFNDGQTISSIWFDPEIGSETGKKQLTDAIKAAQTAFFSIYLKGNKA